MGVRITNLLLKVCYAVISKFIFHIASYYIYSLLVTIYIVLCLLYSSQYIYVGLERLSRHITEKQDKRLKQSGRRHRDEFDAVGSDAINSKNEFFNKKLKRSFDKYTVEVRQNLERGTAI